ncbi:MAG: hypothetical protein QHJ73_05070, partial [Armatimonadota bacterium]|nr:hypothetical protein [Armatimonadota bacterium]
MGSRTRCSLLLFLWVACGTPTVGAVAPTEPALRGSHAGWMEAVAAVRAEMRETNPNPAALSARLAASRARLEREFPLQWDWLLQDAGADADRWLSGDGALAITARMLAKALEET